LIIIQAPKLSLKPHAKTGLTPPLDPDPVQKWAEEGFGVVGVYIGGSTDVQEALGVALAALEQSVAVDTGRYGVLGEWEGTKKRNVSCANVLSV
jgi:carboxymethylenebutenolidase